MTSSPTPLNGALSSRDHREIFSEEEVAAAFALVCSATEARRMARDMYGESGNTMVFAGDLYSALSLLSPDAAARVRAVLRESEAQEQHRLARHNAMRARAATAEPVESALGSISLRARRAGGYR